MDKVNRRELLKIGAAAGGVLTAGHGAGRLAEAMELRLGGEEVSRTTGRRRRSVPTTCLNCYARCGVFAYLEYGRVRKLGGNPDHPNNRGRMCAKGQAGINSLYDPERVLRPLKRVGRRGGGKWKAISWKEAYAELAAKLTDLWTAGKPEGLVFHSERDLTTQRLAKRFMNAFGSPNAIVHATLGGTNKRVAQEMTWGVPVDINDVAYTSYILNFGANPYEVHFLRTSFAQRIAEGRSQRIFDRRVHERAKMVTFDVRLSNTAGKSEEWHPVRPGTDGLVALALANVIMQEGLYNKEFLEKWTNYPIDKLKRHLSQYTPERAERESGVDAEDIRRIALEFAEAKPATTVSAGGVTDHANGVHTERCIALLNAITGNIEVKGGYCLPRVHEFAEPAPVPAEPAMKTALSHPAALPLVGGRPCDLPLTQLRKLGAEIGVYVLYEHNPAYSDPQTEAVATVLKDESLIPYLVVIDSTLSETAALADLVLPSAHYLERLEVDSPPSLELVPLVSLRQPVDEPLGQAKALTDILIDLAHEVGGEMQKYFQFTAEEYWAASLGSIPELVKAGGLSYLRKHGFWKSEVGRPEYQSYKRHGFNTPSGKFEIYSPRMEAAGYHPLPVYEPIPAHRALGKREFVLTTFQWNVHTHARTANCMWLSEIAHTNPVWINAAVAKARGIDPGDLVRLSSDVGSLIAEAHVTHGVHPGVIAVSDNCGHWESGRIAQAEPFRSDDPNTGHLWWHDEGKGYHPNGIIPAAADPVGGGQTWMDTVITLAKVERKKALHFLWFGSREETT
jgi:anaerobic selenocysteine-containing dehydrogenase